MTLARLSIAPIFVFFFIDGTVFAKDPILNHVEKGSRSSIKYRVDDLNPGIIPIDETEIRLQVSDEGLDSRIEESVRFSLKPLGGLANEFKLARQRKKVLELEKHQMMQNQRLQSYREILLIWKVLESRKAILNSAKLFESGIKRLNALKKMRNIDFDLTKHLSNLAYYSEMKAHVDSLYKQVMPRIDQAEESPKSLLTAIQSLQFLELSKVERAIDNMSSAQVMDNLEDEKKSLEYFEYKKKESESYQFLKFVSFSREERNWVTNDFSFQVSLRIPILSDSTELEKAKRDLILSDNKLALEKKAREDELMFLQSKLRGLIEKAKIYQNLSEQSLNNIKLSSSLSTLSVAIDSEVGFLKAKMSLLDTQHSLYEGYLYFLAMQNSLSNERVNYLTTIP